jgi:hypothetical protein
LPRDAGAPPARQGAAPKSSPPADDRTNPPAADKNDPFRAPPPEVPKPDEPSTGAPPPSHEAATDPSAPQPPIASDNADDEATLGSQPPPPAKLRAAGDSAGPIQATFDSHHRDPANQPDARETQKPELPSAVGKPWLTLVASVVLLCCSLGANLYLGWIAWDARTRYRNAVSQFRTAS